MLVEIAIPSLQLRIVPAQGLTGRIRDAGRVRPGLRPHRKHPERPQRGGPDQSQRHHDLQGDLLFKAGKQPQDPRRQSQPQQAEKQIVLHLNDRFGKIPLFRNGAGEDQPVHAQVGKQQRQRRADQSHQNRFRSSHVFSPSACTGSGRSRSRCRFSSVPISQ